MMKNVDDALIVLGSLLIIASLVVMVMQSTGLLR